MMIVESVLSGTYYGWAQMMLVSVKRQLSLCKRKVNHDCAYGIVLCILELVTSQYCANHDVFWNVDIARVKPA